MKKTLRLVIPADLPFAALNLSRDPVTLDIEFDWAPIEKICQLSGIDVALFKDQTEDNVGALIGTWYEVHRKHGGAPDPVQEQLIAEVEAEYLAGDQAAIISHGGGLQ